MFYSCNSKEKTEYNKDLNEQQDNKQENENDKQIENVEIYKEISSKPIEEIKDSKENIEIKDSKPIEEIKRPPEKINEDEQTKEELLNVEVPIYGEPYRYYWIKNGQGDIIWTGSSYEEQQIALGNLSNETFADATYGSSSKQDIIGYETVQIPKSEYENSWF